MTVPQASHWLFGIVPGQIGHFWFAIPGDLWSETIQEEPQATIGMGVLC